MLTSELSDRSVWRDRLAALRNVPPVLRLVWNAAPGVAAAGLSLRVVSAFIPLAALTVSKWIIDLVRRCSEGSRSAAGRDWDATRRGVSPGCVRQCSGACHRLHRCAAG